MKDIYLYTNSKDRRAKARLQRPAKVGEICRIYVDGQYKATAQACMVHGHETACYKCCMNDLHWHVMNICIIPTEDIKASGDYLGHVCCGDSDCYFKDVTDLMEEL